MTTIKIYERVSYYREYHRYMCKWGSDTWFFTDDSRYNTTFVKLSNAENSPKEYSHLVDTFVTSTIPQNYKDLLLLVHTHMPELFI